MKQFKNILLFGGTNDNGEFALRRAAQLAAENGARLTVLDVVKPVPATVRLVSGSIDPSELEAFVCSQRREELEAVCREIVPTEIACEVSVRVGQPGVEIIRAVIQDGHDLVVKVAEGGGFLRKNVFGSVAWQLLRKCPCPVWVLRPDRTPAFYRILAAVDVESTDAAHNGLNEQILELASSLARLENAELHIVQVWQLWMEHALRGRSGTHEFEVDEMLKEQEEATRKSVIELLDRNGLSDCGAPVHVLKGAAGFVIPKLARKIEADLLVMGTVCRTGVPGFLIGNTAERILNDVEASVLALKPVGFETPVELGA